jgi:hypothetical protein
MISILITLAIEFINHILFLYKGLRSQVQDKIFLRHILKPQQGLQLDFLYDKVDK